MENHDSPGAIPEPQAEMLEEQNDGRLIAEAMSHRTRVKILMAMHTPLRRLSPKLFSQEEELPLDHCGYHFRKLEEIGCIALVDTVAHRGALEHIYEPLQLALVWTSVWRTLRPQTKSNILDSVLGGGVRALGRAIDTGAFDARDESHLSWSSMEIDEKGWAEMSSILDSALVELEELKKACLTRIGLGAESLLASYFLVTCESPSPPGNQEGSLIPPLDTGASGLRPTVDPSRKKRRAARKGQDEQQVMASMMRHPTRVQILMTMNTPRRRLSPKQFAEETEHSLTHCSYHFGELEDTGCIELVGTIPRRGGIEHFYEPRRPALQWTEDWKNLGPAIRQTFLASVARGALKSLGLAIADGTFEARDDSYFAWSTMEVDLDGWQDLTDILDRSLKELMRVTDEAWSRVLAGAPRFTASYFIAGFEAPRSDTPGQ